MVQVRQTTNKPISSSLDLTCGWLRILLCRKFWLPSNCSAAIGTRNGVGAVAAAGAGGGGGMDAVGVYPLKVFLAVVLLLLQV